jgi:CBS domain-containing protein
MACGDALAAFIVSDVMRPCTIFVSSRDLVTRARAIMRENGLRTIPVIDGGRLEGIITPKEVMHVTSTRSNIPVAGIMFSTRMLTTPSMAMSELARQMVNLDVNDMPVVQSPTDRTVVGLIKMEDVLGKISSKLPKEMAVKEAMVKDVVTCDEDDEIARIWELMERTRYSGLPVVRHDSARHIKRVVGMITRSDIIGSGATRISEESSKGRASAKVKSLMRTSVITVSPQTPIVEAIELMVKRNVGRLPVTDKDNLVGIICRSDVVSAACG